MPGTGSATFPRLKLTKREYLEVIEGVFFKVPRPEGEPGIFLVFVYFLSPKQCLRPRSNCAPPPIIIAVVCYLRDR